jgi:hypothetical protein
MNLDEQSRKLEELITDFKNLPLEVRAHFFSHEDVQHIFTNWINSCTPCTGSETNAQRVEIRQQFRSRLLKKFKTTGAYAKLAPQLIKYKTLKQGIDLDLLTEEEQILFLNQSYISLPLSQNWMNDFLTDEKPEIITIKKKIQEAYHKKFGFLFKIVNMSICLEMAKEMSNLNEEDQKTRLKLKLDEQWPSERVSLQNYLDFLTVPLHHLQKSYTSTAQVTQEQSQASALARWLGLLSEHPTIRITFPFWFPPSSVVEVIPIDQTIINNMLPYVEGFNLFYKPVKTFFDEIFDLTKNTKINGVLRLIFAFTVVIAVLILIFNALLPLAAHVFLEYVLFIPAVYLAFVIASQCIQFINYMSSLITLCLYGANLTILRALDQDLDLAVEITKYYDSSIKECLKIQAWLSKNDTHLPVSQKKDLGDNLLNYKQNLIHKWEPYSYKNIYNYSEPNVAEIKNSLRADLETQKEKIIKILHLLYQFYLDLNDEQQTLIHPKFCALYTALKEKYFMNKQLENKLSILDEGIARDDTSSYFSPV